MSRQRSMEKILVSEYVSIGRFPREAAVARIEQIRSLRQDGLSIPAIKKLL